MNNPTDLDETLSSPFWPLVIDSIERRFKKPRWREGGFLRYFGRLTVKEVGKDDPDVLFLALLICHITIISFQESAVASEAGAS